MKSHWILCIAVILLLSVAADAALTVHEYVPGQKVTLDTATGHYWYWNLEDFVSMTYPQQVAAIAGLGNYGGVLGGWHMASHDEVAALFSYPASEIGGAFGTTRTHTLSVPIPPHDPIVLFDEEYWMGREDHIVDPLVTPPWRYGPYVTHDKIADTWEKSQDSGSAADPYLSIYFGAWVTSQSGLVPAGNEIPAPSALLLSVIGVTSLIGAKRKRRRQQG